MKHSWFAFAVIVIMAAALLLLVSLATATPGPMERMLLQPEAPYTTPMAVPDSGVSNLVVAAGSTPVVVTGYFINPQGTVEATQVANLGAHGSVLFAPAAANLRKDWIGSVSLAPNSAVGAVAEVYWRGSKLGANNKIEASAYEAVAAPGSVAYLPFVAMVPDNPNKQFSRISVAGSGVITLQYFNRQGTPVPLSPLTDDLGAGGHKTYDLRVPGPLNPTFGNSAWVGSLKIVSQGGQAVSAVASHYWTNRGVLSYPGLTTGTTKHFVPGVERRFDATPTPPATPIPPALLGFSIITTQCLDQSTACGVRMEFYNQGTPSPVATLTCTVAPNAARAANTNSGGDCPDGASLTSLGDNFNGSVVVSSTNDKNLAVVAYTVRPASAMMDGFRSATAANASTWSVAPAVYQKAAVGSGACKDWTTWSQHSIIYIQNPSDTAQAKARLHFYPRAASPGPPTLSYPALASMTPIPPNGFQVFNTKNHCANIWLGTPGQGVNWEGSLHVEAVEGTVVVIVKTIGPGSVMSAYNAFGY